MNFKLSNSLIALAGMIVIGIAMVLMGVTDIPTILLMSATPIWGFGLAKALNNYSAKQEATAQANVIPLVADYRSGEEVGVAA